MKYKLSKDSLEAFIEQFLKRLPDWCTGRTTILEDKFRERYGDKDCNDLIKNIKLHNLKCYLATVAIFLFFIILFFFNNLIPDSSSSLIGKKGRLESIERPKFGQNSERFKLNVELKFQNQKILKEVELNVNSRKMTNLQKQIFLESYAKTLPERILGENKSLHEVIKPLNLFEQDNKNNITIEWTTSDPEVINKNGRLNFVQSKKGKQVILLAEIAYSDYSILKKIPITVKNPQNQREYKILLEGKISSLIETLENNQNGKYLTLPKHLKEGISVQWSTARNHHGGFIVFLFLLIMYAIFHSRYKKIDKERRLAKESILKDFPDLVHKLVLLLNAGLVPMTALSKITDDYNWSLTERRVLYEELYEIQKRVKETNLSIVVQLKDFSKRTGIRELMRFSTILAENINKGTALAEKLEAEVELLWLSRKKNAEEKGRLAETKLTLPLVILLLVLIIITISPALLEM